MAAFNSRDGLGRPTGLASRVPGRGEAPAMIARGTKVRYPLLFARDVLDGTFILAAGAWKRRGVIPGNWWVAARVRGHQRLFGQGEHRSGSSNERWRQ